jgi:hypothetical protein
MRHIKLHTCKHSQQTRMLMFCNIYVVDSSQVQPVVWLPTHYPCCYLVIIPLHYLLLRVGLPINHLPLGLRTNILAQYFVDDFAYTFVSYIHLMDYVKRIQTACKQWSG